MRAPSTLLLVVVAWLGVAPAAVAAECPPGGGTTVVVDFGSLDGGVVVRCAPSATTGFEALAEAGFAVERVQSNPAFLCRIDGRPAADAEDCADIPPDSAFWSYWSAEAGGEWQFQVSGAGSPISGDLEGWAFAAGRATPPDYPVPPAPTTTSTTTITTTTTTTPPPTTSTTTITTTTTTTSPPTTSTTTITTTSPPPTTITSPPPTTINSPPPTTRTTASTTTAPTTTTTAATSPPTTVAVDPSTSTSVLALAATDEGDGSSAPALVAAALGLAGVGVASWLMARRRFGGEGR